MARMEGPRKVRQYTAEFKLKAVKLSQIEGVRVQDVARRSGDSPLHAVEMAQASPRRCD
jgi:transposase-like protein